MKKNKKIVVIGLKGIPAQGGAAAVGENLINNLKNHYNFTVLGISSHCDKNFFDGYNQIIFDSFMSGGINTFFYYIRSLIMYFNNYDLVLLNHAESGFITPF